MFKNKKQLEVESEEMSVTEIIVWSIITVALYAFTFYVGHCYNTYDIE